MNKLKVLDVVRAWVTWYKAGMRPPLCDNETEFRDYVQRMYNKFYSEDRDVFWAAVNVIAKSKHKDWPTAERIERVLIVQRILIKGA